MSPAKLPRLVSPHMIHPNTGFYLKRAPKCRQILCLRIKLTHQLFSVNVSIGTEIYESDDVPASIVSGMIAQVDIIR